MMWISGISPGAVFHAYVAAVVALFVCGIPAALQQHILWGCLLIGLVLWGPGRWALDRSVQARLQQRAPRAGYTRAA